MFLAPKLCADNLNNTHLAWRTIEFEAGNLTPIVHECPIITKHDFRTGATIAVDAPVHTSLRGSIDQNLEEKNNIPKPEPCPRVTTCNNLKIDSRADS
jgi:hypothetical protein